MLLHDIEIQFKSDYEIPHEEEVYHEALVAHFRYEFVKWLEKSGVNCNTVIRFNIYYLVQQRKFYIYHISTRERIIQQNLKEDTKFYQKYFTSTIISSADNE